MWRAMDFLFNKKKKVLKLKDGPQRHLSHLISPLPYFSFHEVICCVAQVTPAELHHIYWIVRPTTAKRSVFDKGSRHSNFNEPPERMRRRSCLPTGAELCGQVQNPGGTTWAVFQLHLLSAFFVLQHSVIWKENKIELFKLQPQWSEDVVWCFSPVSNSSLCFKQNGKSAHLFHPSYLDSVWKHWEQRDYLIWG